MVSIVTELMFDTGAFSLFFGFFGATVGNLESTFATLCFIFVRSTVSKSSSGNHMLHCAGFSDGSDIVKRNLTASSLVLTVSQFAIMYIRSSRKAHTTSRYSL